MKGRVATWLQMRAAEPEITQAEAARRMGITPATLSNMVSIGRKEGWVRLEDPALRMTHEVIPMATDNLVELLAAKNEKATLAVVNGAILPIYRDSIGVHDQASNIIALKIQMPEHMPVIKGTIVGSGRTFTPISNDPDE